MQIWQQAIGFHPTNQSSLYLLRLFYPNNEIADQQSATYWLGQKFSNLLILVVFRGYVPTY